MKKTEKIPAHFSAPARTVPSSRGAKLRAAFLSAAALSAVTEKILFMKESTEGVAEGQTTAAAGSKEDSQGNAGQEVVNKTV